MEKALKYLFLILLSLSVVSCGDDDKDMPIIEEQTIVGKWECQRDAYGNLWDKPLIYLFDEDGTGYQWFSEEPFSDRWEFTYTKTTYKLIIRTNWGNYNLRYELSANGNNLVIYDWDDDDMSELHFKRIN